MANQKRVRLLVAQFVERPVDIIPTRAELTPEMVIRRFPGAVTERANVPPANDLLLYANEFL